MNIFSYNFSLRDIKKSDLIEFAKNPKSAPDTEVTIYMYISWGGKREKYKTSYRVRISDWEEIRLVKKNKEEYAKDVQRVKSGITGSEEINSYLDELELRIKAFDKKCFEKNIIPSKEMAFNVLDGKNAEAPKSEVIMESLTVFKAFEKFIEDSEKGERRTKKGKRISDNTIKQYKSVKRILKEFQEYDKSTLTWGSFNCKNDKFYNRVTNFCWHYKGYFDNYTGHFIKYLKSFLNWVERQEIVSHKLYSENWIVWSEEIDIVVFYPDEMKILFNMELEGLEETRDMFIAGCMTCLRVSNLLALTESDLKSDYLNIVLVKTDKPIKIPVNPILKSIFSKYLLKYNRLLPRISEQEFNYKLNH